MKLLPLFTSLPNDFIERKLSIILEQRSIVLDSSQKQALAELISFYENWSRYQKRFFWKSWLSTTTIPKGIYLWGGVGRGKSLLMDAFYDVIPEQRKTRWHFHAFMRHIHSLLATHKKESDPLVFVAKQLSKKIRLLCFDEFHVSDIADAMILGRLLEHLFRNGTSIVLTSNYPPEALYPNGLQRQNFLPTIQLLKSALQIIEVDGGTDYRHRTLTTHSLYYAPLDQDTDLKLSLLFQKLNGASTKTQEPLLINDRPITVRATGEHIVWFDFDELCGTHRSQHDYLEIAEHFDTILLSRVPSFQSDQAPESIRFKWLIDILYDHRIKLILSAKVAIQNLYPPFVAGSEAGQGTGEAARTLSRLTEMQSDHYLHEAKRPVLDPHSDHSDKKDNITQRESIGTLVSV